MNVCEMTDLLGRSVAITSMCTTKLECFDESRTWGNDNFENEFLEIVTQLLGGVIIY